MMDTTGPLGPSVRRLYCNDLNDDLTRSSQYLIKSPRIFGGPGRRRRRLVLSFLAIFATFVSVSPAPAQTVTWDGVHGTTSNWSDAGNWSGGVAPVTGDAVVLSQTGTNAPSVLDYSFNAHSITLDTATDATTLANGYIINNAGSYVLGLQSGGSITDNATNDAADQINTGITLNGPATIQLSSTAKGLIIGGTGITGTGPLTVTNNSPNKLIEFLADNNYTGGTTITAGTLQLGNGGTTGSITGDVTDNGTLAFDRSDTLTYGGAISGTGAVNQVGSGILVLTGTNTYSGGTNIESGTLSVSADHNLGIGGSGNIVALSPSTTLEFTASGTFSHTATIAGDPTFYVDSGKIVTWNKGISDGASAGTLEVSGGGTLILEYPNTYTGGTTIASGTTLQIDNGGTTGSIVGDVVDNGSLAFDRSDSVTFGGNISESGSVNQLGTGTLTLSGTNLYSGGTVISNGIVSVGADANLGASSGTIEIDNGSELQLTAGFSNSRNVTLGTGTEFIDTQLAVNSTSTFSGLISGLGGLNKTSGGTLALTNNDTYSGGTTISAGILSLGAVNTGSTAGWVTGDVVDNGALWFDRTDDVTFSNVISGSGTVSKYFSNTLTLTNTNTYTGTTFVNAGTLQLGNGGATGSVAGDIYVTSASSSVVFNHGSNDMSYAGSVIGSGSLVKDGSGTLTFTGTGTYSGGTTISGGTLQLGNGGTTGSISGDIVDNANLAIDIDHLVFNLPGPPPTEIDYNYNLTGVISGTGSLEKLGSGTTILSGNNTYSGGTTISGGTLQIGAGGTPARLWAMSPTMARSPSIAPILLRLAV